MIEIGHLPNARAALALTDYLKGRGIECQLTPSQTGVTLYVIHSQDCLAAQQEFEQFIKNPHDPKYLQASWEHGKSGLKLDYGTPSLQLFSQFITGAGPLTLIIFAICLLIFAGLNLGFGEAIYHKLSFFGAAPESSFYQFWRIFTPSLLHFSVLHLVFNLLWWWYLGGKIENKLGLRPLLVLLLIAGTLPSLVQYLITGPHFGGLSGVVYALVGYCWLIGNKRPELGVQLPPAYMGFMLFWLVLGFTDLFGLSIANGAHIGGLIIGLIQGWFDAQTKNSH